MMSLPPVYKPSAQEMPLPQQVLELEGRRPSSYFVENGAIKFYDGVKAGEVSVAPKDRRRMIQAMKMRDAVRSVLDIQVNDGADEDLKKAQFELNAIYDDYVRSYGHICEDAALKKIFGNDLAYPLLRSLEEYGKDGYKGKSSIFRALEFERIYFDFHEDAPPYEPQNEIERKILASKPEGDSYFSFSRYYAEKTDGTYLQALDEEFERRDAEHDLMLYDFLKKELARYEGDIDSIRQQLDNRCARKFTRAMSKTHGSSTSGSIRRKNRLSWTAPAPKLSSFARRNPDWKKICRR